MHLIKILFLLITSMPAYNSENGKTLFTNHCAKCHGDDGTKGRFGAKNLQASTLTVPEYFRIISDGKRIMPSWKKKLSADEINQVITYIQTLRK